MAKKRSPHKQFLQGNAIAACAALAAGATQFYGYPITPSTEIFETWVALTGDPRKPAQSPVTGEKLQYLQCEDEMASGFAMIGSCMAGRKAFTATAGPGNILMQDAFVMAEALRIPTVALIMQRGGMSTSTVIYSQEEVTLTCFGGNGEGFRIVYSPSSLQELYELTMKSFNVAWEYRFPTFVLGDGYLGKMEGAVQLRPLSRSDYVEPQPILLKDTQHTDGTASTSVNLRNCYDQEEEINSVIEDYAADFRKVSTTIAESEHYRTRDAHTVVIAHGIVAEVARAAVDTLRKDHIRVGLWRPISLRPLDVDGLAALLASAHDIIFVESALGQLASLVGREVVHNNRTKLPIFRDMFRPAIGITPEEIIDVVLDKK